MATSKSKIMSDLSHQAIKAALTSEWKKAISLNESLLKENKNDIDALNRLAYANIQIGEIEQAKKIYRKTLSLDRYNFIAQKNLARIDCFTKGKKIVISANKYSSLSPSLFIEDPGKTKTVNLKNIAPQSLISKLHIGDPVVLKGKKHSIEVRDQMNNYLGAIPDDIAFRLIRFLKAGNFYQVNIRNIQKNCLSVFIREIKRGKRFFNQPTFLRSRSDLQTTSGLDKTQTETGEDDKEDHSPDEADL